MELYSKIVEFFDNNEEKKKKIHNNYTLHIFLIIFLFIFVLIGFYYISDIMSLIGLNNDSNDPNVVNKYGESTRYSETHGN